MPAPDPAITLDAASATVLLQSVNNALVQGANGMTVISEQLRYDYMDRSKRVSFADATGVRHVEESGSGAARYLASMTSPLQGVAVKTS